jgi:hypothetical protein
MAKGKKGTKATRKNTRAIARIKKSIVQKISTVVIPEGQIELLVPAPAGQDGKAFGLAQCYIQPLSIALRSNAQDTQWGQPETIDGRTKRNCRDNLGLILRHRPIFNWGAGGTGQVSLTSTPLTGMSSTANYRMWSSQKTHSCTVNYQISAPQSALPIEANSPQDQQYTYVVAVIKPVRKVADFVTSVTGAKQVYSPVEGQVGAVYELKAPGSLMKLVEGTDYMINGGAQPINERADAGQNPILMNSASSLTGVIFNPRRWKVVYKRYHNLRDAKMNPDIKLTDPQSNFQTQYGKIKLRLNDSLHARRFNPTGIPDNGVPGTLIPQIGGTAVSSIGYVSEAAYQFTKNENTAYLVCIHNTVVSQDGAVGLGARLSTRTIFNHSMSNSENGL